MKQYGIQNVRGGSYCQEILTESQINILEIEMKTNDELTNKLLDNNLILDYIQTYNDLLETEKPIIKKEWKLLYGLKKHYTNLRQFTVKSKTFVFDKNWVEAELKWFYIELQKIDEKKSNESILRYNNLLIYLKQFHPILLKIQEYKKKNGDDMYNINIDEFIKTPILQTNNSLITNNRLYYKDADYIVHDFYSFEEGFHRYNIFFKYPQFIFDVIFNKYTIPDIKYLKYIKPVYDIFMIYFYRIAEHFDEIEFAYNTPEIRKYSDKFINTDLCIKIINDTLDCGII
jgi:hypothetical protein